MSCVCNNIFLSSLENFHFSHLVCLFCFSLFVTILVRCCCQEVKHTWNYSTSLELQINHAQRTSLGIYHSVNGCSKVFVFSWNLSFCLLLLGTFCVFGGFWFILIIVSWGEEEAGRYLMVHCAVGDVAQPHPATWLGNKEQRSYGILGHPHNTFSFILMLVEQGSPAIYQEFKNCLLPRSNLDQVFPLE